jgi:hypothetical protein
MSNTTYANTASYTLGNITVPSSDYIISASGSSGQILTASASGPSWSVATNSTATPMTVNQSGRITLTGDNADLDINGISLNETLQAIQNELRIPGRIKRDLQLEKEFEELNEAAKHYNTLLEKYQEQKKVWGILQKQDQ